MELEGEGNVGTTIGRMEMSWRDAVSVKVTESDLQAIVQLSTHLKASGSRLWIWVKTAPETDVHQR